MKHLSNGYAEVQPTHFSLFDIEAGWAPLVEARIEAEELTGPEREAAVEAADVALAEHAERELVKVDSYIGICKFLQFRADADEAEARRKQASANIAKAMLRQIKATGMYAMDATGRKRIDGSRGYLAVKGNGGVQPLIISDESLLPDDCCRMEGWISGRMWQHICDSITIDPAPDDYILKRVPDNAAIRTKLLEPCPACMGGGNSASETGLCPDCAGTGRNAVAGAYLEARGRHLEIR